LYNRVLSSITQCQQSNRRIVDVGRHGASINNTVAGIPPSARTRAIEKHLDAAIETHRDALKTTARARELV
jgi:precorrin-6B methylase 2